MQNLRDLLIANGATGLDGWILTEALSISADGQTLVGNGVNPLGQTEAWLATLTIDEIPSGDFDGDGDVDGRDFLQWQRGGSPNPLSAGDLANWQAEYSAGLLTAASDAVPEPAAAGILTSLCFLTAVFFQRTCL